MFFISEEKTVSESGLPDNTKIFLVVKKTEESQSSQVQEGPHLWTELGNLLRRHFREEDARKVLDEFRKVRFSKWNVFCCSWIYFEVIMLMKFMMMDNQFIPVIKFLNVFSWNMIFLHCILIFLNVRSTSSQHQIGM